MITFMSLGCRNSGEVYWAVNLSTFDPKLFHRQEHRLGKRLHFLQGLHQFFLINQFSTFLIPFLSNLTIFEHKNV